MHDENYKRAIANLERLLKVAQPLLEDDTVRGVLEWDIQYLKTQPQYGDPPHVH